MAPIARLTLRVPQCKRVRVWHSRPCTTLISRSRHVDWCSGRGYSVGTMSWCCVRHAALRSAAHPHSRRVCSHLTCTLNLHTFCTKLHTFCASGHKSHTLRAYRTHCVPFTHLVHRMCAHLECASLALSFCFFCTSSGPLFSRPASTMTSDPVETAEQLNQTFW